MPRQAALYPLVGAEQAEEQSYRHVGIGQGRGERAGQRCRQVGECAVMDHVHLGGIYAEAIDELRAAVLGVHDDCVNLVVKASLRLRLPGVPGFPWQQVVSR